ncbi:AsmA family protein [Bacteroidaceae bacterium HV4-6-C5C]|nr:AsmA family protein [Bacteroidaceae bacterium HV4-6-C5C]
MKKKKLAQIGGIALAVILLVMLILPFAFQGKIGGIVKTEGNKMLNGKFDFSKLSISLFKHFPQASVSLEDFYLKGEGDFKNDTLIQAREMTATINLFSLFGNSGYDISKIYIDNASVKAIVLANGKVNWDVMKSDTTANVSVKEEASEFRLKIKHLAVSDLNLIYDDRQSNQYAVIKKLKAECSGDLTSNRTILKLNAETEALSYKVKGIPFLSNASVSAKMDIDANLAENKYTFKENEFHLNAIKAGLDGWIAMKDPAMQMDLKLKTNEVGFKEILSLVPAIYAKNFSDLKTDGKASLSGYAKGTLQGDTVPAFNIDMQVKNAMFHYPSLPAGVDQINVSANVKNPGGNVDLTTIDIRPFSFRLAGNPFSVNASIKTPVSDPDIKAEAKGILNLGMIKKVYPLDSIQLNGVVNANMRLATLLSYIEKEQYDKVQASGTIGLTGMKLKMKDMPDVDIKKSLLTFTPKFLQLSETTVNIGKNDFTIDSRLENYLGYALKNTTLKGTLNLQSNNLNLNDFMGTTSVTNGSSAVAPATSGNHSTGASATIGVFEVPKNVDFQIDANLKKVLFDKMVFEAMKGKIVVKDSKVDMNNLSMNTMGGSMIMNGVYSTVNIKKPFMNAGFKMSDVSFAQAYKELDMVRKLAPVFENLKGTFSGNLKVQTDLDQTMSPVLNTMQGNGELSTHNISLSGIKAIDMIAEAVKKPGLKDMKVKDLNIDFTIKDGRVSTKPFDIKWGEYLMNLSGTTGLDQTIDYAGKVKLPSSLGSYANLSTVDLKIGGTFTSPKVSLDTKSMANQAVKAVENQALNKLGKKLGLDSVASANKDSIKKKVTEKAVDKALDFLRKKMK